jgi:hypothetical protein
VHHIILSYRLKEDYFKWTSLRIGSVSAMLDYKKKGILRVLVICMARIGKNLLVNLPILALSSISNDNSEAIGQKCLILRTKGYFNFTLQAIAPKLFSQAKFFSNIEFRKEQMFNDSRDCKR